MSRVFTIVEGLENLGAMRTGGQGSVYKGRRTGTILTAVKLLPTPIHHESQDDANYRRFQNEVDKLRKVNEQPSPHVVKILSSGLTESGSFPFIEMEFIEGPDLGDLLEPPKGEKVFTIKETIKVAEQLASALAHCHGVGVKHGDIKSNNVKYNVHTGNYVLLDFGLAVMSDEQRRSSVRHAGAIEFMAPEQHEGVMLPQTDVYSYGVVLYELLAGQVPFPLHDSGETSRNTVLVSHMESPIPNLMELRSKNLPSTWTYEKQLQEMQVPEWLISLIMNCLSKKPEQRYASGVELHQAVVQGTLSASVSSGNEGTAVARITALQSENKRLEDLLLQYQQADAGSPVKENDGSNVSISKPLFAAILFILVSSMAFSMYTLFFKKSSPYNAANSQYQDSVSNNEPMRADTAGSFQPEPQTPVNTQPTTTPQVDTPVVQQPPVKKPKPAQDSTETPKTDSTDVEQF
ncbi:serine/threonine protein kinase [Mucilaginibacter sp. Bleaf8]|uniref:serine/threonine protein kinase n=1 Tax=Mucilaginibacter sp. Bleaf8 TaxID=2834430 RepID=UPI001BCE00C4|nr:serine/threonine-protein kinase [Mucilaginibacter sp. Bleaf8]MBS7564955.1 serine/threonine protein kinase [Mucilaginibacter sp. Bleaf8]